MAARAVMDDRDALGAEDAADVSKIPWMASPSMWTKASNDQRKSMLPGWTSGSDLPSLTRY